MTDLNQPNILSEDLSVSPLVAERVQSITKWARFMAIVSIVILSIALLMVIFVGTAMSTQMESVLPGLGNLSGALFIIIFLVAIGIVGALMYFLLRFANLTARALQLRNQEMLNNGLASLKTYFAIYAILAIIGIVGSLLTLLR